MQDIVMPLAELIESSFIVLEMLENLPNMLFIALGFVGLFYWLRLQKKYNEQADADGTLR
jgi:hypothetical protein